ncbi:hypothetical protein CDAR_239851 [Caerostris darwini]|uniref:Uncharacterized protein n=1 Tax=Caerostris darwini TaxID=1538125 RepID=A0AAV4R200_9ARAC|nr:hypothetical protein CDAR_239851 [Caerostris darwini]
MGIAVDCIYLTLFQRGNKNTRTCFCGNSRMRGAPINCGTGEMTPGGCQWAETADSINSERERRSHFSLRLRKPFIIIGGLAPLKKKRSSKREKTT